MVVATWVGFQADLTELRPVTCATLAKFCHVLGSGPVPGLLSKPLKHRPNTAEQLKLPVQEDARLAKRMYCDIQSLLLVVWSQSMPHSSEHVKLLFFLPISPLLLFLHSFHSRCGAKTRHPSL